MTKERVRSGVMGSGLIIKHFIEKVSYKRANSGDGILNQVILKGNEFLKTNGILWSEKRVTLLRIIHIM